MPKRDFNKVALQLYSNHTSAQVFSYKMSAYFQNKFSQEHFLMAASDNKCSYKDEKYDFQIYSLAWLLIQ